MSYIIRLKKCKGPEEIATVRKTLRSHLSASEINDITIALDTKNKLIILKRGVPDHILNGFIENQKNHGKEVICESYEDYQQELTQQNEALTNQIEQLKKEKSGLENKVERVVTRSPHILEEAQRYKRESFVLKTENEKLKRELSEIYGSPLEEFSPIALEEFAVTKIKLNETQRVKNLLDRIREILIENDIEENNFPEILDLTSLPVTATEKYIDQEQDYTDALRELEKAKEMKKTLKFIDINPESAEKIVNGMEELKIDYTNKKSLVEKIKAIMQGEKIKGFVGRKEDNQNYLISLILPFDFKESYEPLEEKVIFSILNNLEKIQDKMLEKPNKLNRRGILSYEIILPKKTYSEQDPKFVQQQILNSLENISSLSRLGLSIEMLTLNLSYEIIDKLEKSEFYTGREVVEKLRQANYNTRDGKLIESVRQLAGLRTNKSIRMVEKNKYDQKSVHSFIRRYNQ